jgi:hypothetical protein
MTIESIAKVCHEANRAYCAELGDASQKPWEESPDWQRRSAVDGVRFHLDNPSAGPRGSHENWLRAKLADGWAYGKTKDAAHKTHPCLVDYDELPADQRVKDSIFVGIVHALATLLA